MISPITFEDLISEIQNNNKEEEEEEEKTLLINNNRKRKLNLNLSSSQFNFKNNKIQQQEPFLNISTSFDNKDENILEEEKEELISSNNNLFNQTILNLTKCEEIKNNKNEEEKEEEIINNFDKQHFQMFEFFEAQKALQRMFSQFIDQQKICSSSSTFNPSPFLLPFQQQIVSQLSPFFLNQQQSTSSEELQQLLFSSSSSSSDSFNNNNLINPFLFNQQLFQQKYLNNNNSELINNNLIPEDLTKENNEQEEEKEEKETSTSIISENIFLINNNNEEKQNWSYEDQFKQLYDLSEDTSRKEWLNDWLQFMHKINKPVTRIPIMAKQVLDLYELYRLVVQHGGLVEVINKKLWREITKGLNLPPSITSAAFTLRTQYSKYLFDYECHRHNFSNIADLQAAVDGNKREGRKPGITTNTTLTNNSISTTPPSILQKQEQNFQQQQSSSSSTNSLFLIPSSSSSINNNNNNIITQMIVAAAAFNNSFSSSQLATLFNNNNLPIEEENILKEEQQQLNDALNLTNCTKQIFDKFNYLDLIKEGNNNIEEEYLIPNKTTNNNNYIYSKMEEEEEELSKSLFNQKNKIMPEKRPKTSFSSIQSNNNKITNFKQLRSQSVNTVINNNEEKEEIINLNQQNPINCLFKINGINENIINKGIIKFNENPIISEQLKQQQSSSLIVSLDLNGIIYEGILFSNLNNKNINLLEESNNTSFFKNLEIFNNNKEKEENWKVLLKNNKNNDQEWEIIEKEKD